MTVDQLKNEIRSDIVVVDFTATRCTVCHQMYPIVEELSWNYNVKLIKLDADDDYEVFDHYEVYGVPHLKVFINGEEQATATGPKQRSDLEKIFSDSLTKLEDIEEQERLSYADYF